MRFVPVLLVACSSSHVSPDASLSDAGADSSVIRDSGQPTETSIDASSDAMPDACGDTTSDPSNCGTCGHDCLGGTCTNGRCDRVVLLNLYAQDLVLGPNDVYFTDGYKDEVGKCAKTGCNNTPTWLSQGGSLGGIPNKITTDQKTLFWTLQATVMPAVESIPINGGTVSLFGMGQTRPYSIATEGTHVFWTAEGEVRGCPISGCTGSPTVIAPLYGLGYYPTWIAVDSANVYFVSNGAVAMCPVSGCGNNGPTTLFTVGPYDAGPLVSDGVNLYSGVNGFIYKCAIAGCNNTPTLLYKSNGTSSIATDGTDVYFGDGYKLIRCPVNGGCFQSPVVMAETNVNVPSGIVVDATKVFFADNGSGNSVYFVAK